MNSRWPLPAALSRFSSYADVAGVGGASAASTWASSVNPASADWRDAPGSLGLCFCPNTPRYPFKKAASSMWSMNRLTWQDAQWGTFLPAAAQVRSNHATPCRDSVSTTIWTYFQMQWGKRFAENWAVGGISTIPTSEVELRRGFRSSLSLTDTRQL